MPSYIVSVKDYGAVGDGVTDDTVAKNNAEAANASVYWPAGNYKLTSPPTLGKSWGVGVPKIGTAQQYLHPTPGPVSEVLASVFNPPTNGTGNAQTQLQLAVNFAQANDLRVKLQANASYRMTSSLVFQLARTGSETKQFNAYLDGNFCTFKPAAGIPVILVEPRSLTSEIATGKDVGELELRNFNVDGGLFASAAAIQIGKAGRFTSCGFKFGQVENVLITGIKNFNAISIVECRMLQFTNVVVRGGGLSINANTAKSFAGDMVFTACEFGGDHTDHPALSIMAGVSANTNAQCRGIHFHGCFFYKTESRLISVGANSIVGDVFFTDCQWDAGLTNVSAFTCATNNSGIIDGVHLIHPYIVQWSAEAIRCTTQGQGQTSNFFVDGAQVGMNTDSFAAFNMHGIKGATVTNCRFMNCSNKVGSMNFDSCVDLIVTGNITTGITPKPTYGIIIGNASTRYNITNNVIRTADTVVVNDYSAGTPIRMTNNNLVT